MAWASQVKHPWHFTRWQYHVCQMQPLITSSLETLMFPSKDLIFLDVMAGAALFLLLYRCPFSYAPAKQPQFSSIPCNTRRRKRPTAALCQWPCGAHQAAWPIGPGGLDCRIGDSSMGEQNRSLKSTMGLRKREALSCWLDSLSFVGLLPVELKWWVDEQNKKQTSPRLRTHHDQGVMESQR